MRLALTHRNYAGMSVRPETVHVNASNMRMWMSDIHEMDVLKKEYSSIRNTHPYLLLDAPGSEELSVISVEKLNRTDTFYCYGFKMRLSKPLFGSVDARVFCKMCTFHFRSKITEALYDSVELAN